MTRRRALAAAVVPLLAACEKPAPRPTRHKLGETVQSGPLKYSVLATRWALQTGEGLAVRTPTNRYYILQITVLNTGKTEVFVPALSIESASGQSYDELADGAGVPNWIGVVRRLNPAETLEGAIAFDVPQGTYALRVPNEEDAITAYIDLPFQLDSPTLK